MFGYRLVLTFVSLITFSAITFAHATEEKSLQQPESTAESKKPVTSSLADPNTKVADHDEAKQPEVISSEKISNANPVESTKKVTTEVRTKTSIGGSVVNQLAKTEENAVKESHPDLQVLEFVLADNIEGREPKSIVENFNQQNQKGFAFARLSCLKQSTVTFVWLRNGKEQTRFTTTVHTSKKWRTFASSRLKKGEWVVRLLADDKIIAEKSFTIQ